MQIPSQIDNTGLKGSRAEELSSDKLCRFQMNQHQDQLIAKRLGTGNEIDLGSVKAALARRSAFTKGSPRGWSIRR